MQRCLGALLPLLAAVAATGCGGNATSRSGTPSQPAAIKRDGKSYLEELLRVAETHSVNKTSIDWTALRAQVFAAAGGAQTSDDIDSAIDLAVRSFGDKETYYTAADGKTIGPPPVGGCAAPAAVPPPVPDRVGYVKIPSCPCDGNAVAEFAEALQRTIRTSDRAALAGWIVDVRGNFGGNMWPMIAGVGPILGEGIIGYIVYNDRQYEREYRGGAALSLGEPFARVESPYVPYTANPKISVLTDGATASAGEAMAVFFKGRSDTRTFGTATCGHHHLQQDYRLSDGATLSLATSQHADRTHRRYAGAIEPDETIADPAAAVNRAVAWLLGS